MKDKSFEGIMISLDSVLPHFIKSIFLVVINIGAAILLVAYFYVESCF